MSAAPLGDGYEVIRKRLLEEARLLGERAAALNERRKAAFGASETAVLGTERVRTENNSVPCDIVMIGGHLLFGFNVFIGLKTETTVADVFSLHRLAEQDGAYEFPALGPDDPGGAFLREPRFLADFRELYRFYRATRLVKLSRSETQLLAVFRTGANATDLRVFRWALDPRGGATYVDNRGERDFVFPPQHDFEWVRTSREHQVRGRHPHVNVLDQVFVETLGGDLTIKIENNTEDGQGIYREPVDDPRQNLDDADIQYAAVGTLILLKIRPFGEAAYRHLVFDTRAKAVVRIDALGEACIRLPEDHGIIFPGGYYLKEGQHKVFDGEFDDLEFERAHRAPSGEDVLYVFHRRRDGLYLLLPYNLIEKKVSAPVRCHGYSLFADGRMVVFRSASDEPTRVHPMQVWRTPFCSPEHAAAAPAVGGALGRIGNAELVRGISDVLGVKRLVEETRASRQIYEDLIATIVRTTDAHHWLGQPEAEQLLPLLHQIKGTAELVVDEFEKAEAIRARAVAALAEARARQEALVGGLRPETWSEIGPYLEGLAALRAQRGHLVTLRDLRYVDLEAIDRLDADAAQAFDRLSDAAMAFLGREDALAPVLGRIAALLDEVPTVGKSRDLASRMERIGALGDGLTVLSEVVGGLAADDPTSRTAILERISGVFAQLNRLRAVADGHRKTLLRAESAAEFAAQYQLFGQSVASALALAVTPEACDQQLSRLMVQLEELEARFSELEEHLTQLADKREEVYEAFTQRKQALLDERQRRAETLVAAGARILGGIERRSAAFKAEAELHGYFAADPMVAKLREVVAKLTELGDSTRADELTGRLKAAQQNSLRGLRDRLDLYDGGDDVIRLGKHQFLVNTQPLELTLVPHAEGMALTLTGTDLREPITDEAFLRTRPFWSQALASESEDVYRGEFLAATLLAAAEAGEEGLTVPALREARRDDRLEALVRDRAAARYDEGYERGLHDADAARILGTLLDLHEEAGLLRFGPRARALACLFWAFGADAAARTRWQRLAGSLGRLRQTFAGRTAAAFELDLAGAIAAFAATVDEPRTEAPGASASQGLGAGFGAGAPGAPGASAAGASGASAPDTLEASALEAARYLAEELVASPVRFVTAAEAVALRDGLLAHLDRQRARHAFEEDLTHLAEDRRAQLALARTWLRAYLETTGPEGTARAHLVDEAAVLLVTERGLDRDVSGARTTATVDGLLGQHPRIVGGTLPVRLDELVGRVDRFARDRVPGFRAFRRERLALLERERTRLRVDELQPRVLTSFVRNRLIDEVYLPLIGDNLAKQLGAAGAKKRTDLMGLLLLISPPGYGKTTLMEYVASRLGLVFVKVNGPALGHEVRSVDPAEAPNATARQEVEKINLAFELGNNVMLYLDDIQHTHPELLQKFISLCDGQRRVEGVWRGRTRTYDLRGKKFCIVMAGNPYTESGEKFKIPDMLANRADTYNLGDVLSGREEVFATSYIENAVTSNPVLAPLATRAPGDLHKLIRMARGEAVPASELEHAHAPAEIAEMVAILQRLFKIQRVLLAVNQAYIASASTDDRFRTEPPFKLQGSYRNMNKLAEKVVAAMTDDELDRLVEDHYAGEAQTLTSGAEQNVLKLAELRGRLGPEAAARWEHIKTEFRRSQRLGGAEEDPVTRVTRQLGDLGARLDDIRAAMAAALGAVDRFAASRTRPNGDGQPGHDGHDGAGAPRWLEAHLHRVDETLKTLRDRKLELTVHSPPPRGVEELLGQQVAIVERTLVPLVKVATERLHDRSGLETKVEQLLAELRTLQLRAAAVPPPVPRAG